MWNLLAFNCAAIWTLLKNRKLKHFLSRSYSFGANIKNG